jgi:dTDP-4-amino-4,6-dideoxygalactose transaminase
VKIDFARPDREHELIRTELEEAAGRVIRSGQSILGEEVLRFEQAFAKQVGVRHAVGVSNGTDALVTALHALGLGAGDAVIVAAFGFVAAAEAIVRVGARPVFVDVEPMALSIAPGALCEAKAIISVDLFGLVHDLAPLRASLPGVPIVEDAAQAMGSTFAGSTAGTLGDIGTFSFFPSKALGAAGDAGACVTNDGVLAASIARIRSHGVGKTYAWEIPGGNYRLDALQAAILEVKVTRLPARLARRRVIGKTLAAAARRGGAEPLTGSPDCDPVHAPLAIRVPNRRNEVLARLRERDIDARIHYPSILPDCPPFANYALGHSFPESKRATLELLSVPCHPELTDEEVEYLETAIVIACQ